MVSSTNDQKCVDSVALSRGSRRFPEHLFASTRTDRFPIRSIEPTPREDRVAAGLREAICERLPWNSLALSETSRNPIISSYKASLDLVKQYQQDVDHFLTEVCLANLEFRQAKGETNAAGRDHALKSKLRSLLALLPQSWLPVHNILVARAASLPVAELRYRLQESLEEGVSHFTQQLFDRLALLVDHQVFGLVEWLPRHVCLYHYYKQVVIQENDGAVERVVDKVFHDGQRRDFKTGRRVVGEQTVEVVAGQGTHQHRLARHEHHVIDAIRTTPGNSTVVYPVEVQRLVSKIPDWLYPFVEVIDGTLIGERIIEQDTTIERWEDSKVEVRPILGCEPAVIIGPYVLTGWGPREIQQELDRRTSVAAKQSLPLLITASGLLMALALYVTVLAHLWRLPGLLPMLATAGSAVMIWLTAHSYVSATRQTSPRLFTWLATTMLVSILLLIEWLIARFFQPVSWLIPLGLMALAIATCKVGGWLESGK